MSSATADRIYHEGWADGREQFARELHAMLFPEQYPPGDKHHDPDHVYWNSGDGWQWLQDKAAAEAEEEHFSDTPLPFEWDSGTIEWVAQELESELA